MAKRALPGGEARWSFVKARAFVRALGLASSAEWRVYCAGGKKPAALPSRPDVAYASQWISMGDWLGNGGVNDKARTFRSFDAAREFAQGLALTNREEWWAFAARPEDVPLHPERVYATEWLGWGDFLGTGNTRRV